MNPIAMAKTNKSFKKRLKLTSSGKIMSRIPGKNHFNAKSARSKQLQQKGWRNFDVSKRTIKKFMPNASI